ncbi:MAG: hypothetical protein GYB38_02325 [Gammaproteobacteria bacterium]|nr:hypothetical protein [Gammaproteobacteria bacterium]
MDNKLGAHRRHHAFLWGGLVAVMVVASGASAQRFEPPAVAPLNKITVPDINKLGILDGAAPDDFPDAILGNWPVITNTEKRTDLQRLGKALFWDMQVGSDGITACASCHYHAGADHRSKNQISPGLKRGDDVHDLAGLGTANGQLLNNPHYMGINDFGTEVGFAVNENELLTNQGWSVDAVDGTPGNGGKGNTAFDINDVASSQGQRAGTFTALSGGRVDSGTLDTDDNGQGFTVGFPSNALNIPDTARRVEPRNAPTVINAVYNLRNFWDGRADTFFNGVSPLGFRDPGAQVPTYTGGNDFTPETLRIPFSALASQAVGPPLSNFEMSFANRNFAHIGKKLGGSTIPLNGQKVACDDDLLSSWAICGGTGLNQNYHTLVKDIFDERFWGDGNGAEVCVEIVNNEPQFNTCDGNEDFTLLEYNFALFFGLAVQAYEATLTSDYTIVDLLAGGIATGTVTNGTGRRQLSFVVDGQPLEACVNALALNNNAAGVADAEQVCAEHYASFIPVGAVAGSEINTATQDFATVVNPGASIGLCNNPPTCNDVVDNANILADAVSTLQAIDRGVGRFFAGATGCGICHFNPEFTGATVSALTGFGAVPPPPLPPGQLRKEALEVPLERMITFNGQAQVYDAGFYNIGVRPSSDDISLGDIINGVPLSFSWLRETILRRQLNEEELAFLDPALSDANVDAVAQVIDNGELLIPTAPDDLTPRVFDLALACGPGLVGNPNAQGRRNGDPNNNPNVNCVPDVVIGEKILRYGAFKASGLRNVKYTGPYFHNGAKKNLRQVVETYKTAGHFPTINFNNLDAGMREFDLGAQDEASLVEMLETGLTDWRVALESGKFSHPQLCIPHGHNDDTGETILVNIAEVGAAGHNTLLQTFEGQLTDAAGIHDLQDPCEMPTISNAAGLSMIDVPPAAP